MRDRTEFFKSLRRAISRNTGLCFEMNRVVQGDHNGAPNPSAETMVQVLHGVVTEWMASHEISRARGMESPSSITKGICKYFCTLELEARLMELLEQLSDPRVEKSYFERVVAQVRAGIECGRVSGTGDHSASVPDEEVRGPSSRTIRGARAEPKSGVESSTNDEPAGRTPPSRSTVGGDDRIPPVSSPNCEPETIAWPAGEECGVAAPPSDQAMRHQPQYQTPSRPVADPDDVRHGRGIEGPPGHPKKSFRDCEENQYGRSRPALKHPRDDEIRESPKERHTARRSSQQAAAAEDYGIGTGSKVPLSTPRAPDAYGAPASSTRGSPGPVRDSEPSLTISLVNYSLFVCFALFVGLIGAVWIGILPVPRVFYSPPEVSESTKVDLCFSVGDFDRIFDDWESVSYAIQTRDGATIPRASRSKGTITLPGDPQIDYQLACETQGQELLFRFEREIENGSLDNSVVRYASKTRPTWSLVKARLELLVERVWNDQGNGTEPCGVEKDDRLEIVDSRGNRLATLRFLESRRSVLLPVSEDETFKYHLTSPSSGVTNESLEYDRRRQILTRKAVRSDIRSIRLVDELTGIDLTDGRVVVGKNLITNEKLTVGYLPKSWPDDPGYYSVPMRSNSNDKKLLMRRMAIECKTQFIDELTKRPVEGVDVKVTGGAVYDGQRLMFFPPQLYPSLNNACLLVQAEDYEPIKVPLESLARQNGNKAGIRFVLKRRNNRIVIIWPATIGMGRAMGKHKFSVPKAFLERLKSALVSTCKPLGYAEVELFVLKDRGLESYNQDTPPTYQAADRPEALLVRSPCGGVPAVFDDPKLKGRIGKHTVIIVILGDFSVPPVEREGERENKGMGLHRHLVKLWPAETREHDPYVLKYCQENSDKVTSLSVDDMARMVEDARQVAADVGSQITLRLEKK